MEFQTHARRCARRPSSALHTPLLASLSLGLLAAFALPACGTVSFAPGKAASGVDVPDAPSSPAKNGPKETDAGNRGGDADGVAEGRTDVPPAATPTPTPATTTAETPTMPVPNPVVSPTAGPGVTPTPRVVTGDLCAGRQTSLRVLVLDLKSGWLAGDGGDTFQEFTSSACAAKVEIVYAHITKTLVEGTIFLHGDRADILSCLSNPPDFVDTVKGSYARPELHTLCTVGDLSSFQQVWILSGSEADSDDVTRDSAFFTSLKQRLAAFAHSSTPRGLFLGVGLGNTQHANALAASLFPASSLGSPGAELFEARQWGELGQLPDPEAFRKRALAPLLPAPAQGALGSGTFDASHPLVAGLPNLADYEKAGSASLCSGDAIVMPHLSRGAGLLGVDACGQATVAAFGGKGTHRVVLDANMPRFYVTRPQDWFNRIADWLAHAGE